MIIRVRFALQSWISERIEDRLCVISPRHHVTAKSFLDCDMIWVVSTSWLGTFSTVWVEIDGAPGSCCAVEARVGVNDVDKSPAKVTHSIVWLQNLQNSYASFLFSGWNDPGRSGSKPGPAGSRPVTRSITYSLFEIAFS